MISNTVLFFRHVGRGGSGLRHVRGVLLCVALFAVLLLSTAAASAQTVTLHSDSGQGDNVDSGVAADNMTFDSTPKITLAGFTGSITVTSTSDGQTDVVDTFAAGNGDRDLSTLAPGEWLLTAVDSAGTPNTATLTITVLHPMVSNFAESDDGTLVVGDFDGGNNVRKIAQAFTTGADLFRLREVQIDIGAAVDLDAGSSFEIELMTANGANPGTRVTTSGCNIFNGIAHNEVSTNNIFTYEIPDSKDCTLAPNTTYFLVFQIKNRGNRDLQLTAVSGDAQSGQTGWSMADACRQADVGAAPNGYGSAGSWGDCAGGRSVKLGLFGTPVSQTLVSNLGQTITAGYSVGSNHVYAQQFTTGGTPFVLATASISIARAASGTAGTTTVSIQRADGDGNPDGVDLVSAEVTDENVVGIKTVDFTSADVVLKPSTNYFLVISRGAGASTFQLGWTTSNNEDAGGATGYSIADGVLSLATNGSWVSVNTQVFAVAIGGKSEPVAYLKDASDTGKSPQDRRTHDYTPTVVLSGFSGTVTVTATSGVETAVQATRNGDGEVTLPRLTPGKIWTIAAVSDADADAFPVFVDKLLVGNFNVRATAATTLLTVFAQKFSTADVPYALEEIQYVVSTAPSDSSSNEFIISVRSGGPGGTNLATINVDHDDIESTGTKTAVLDTPLTLAANTDYVIVFEYIKRDSGASPGFRVLVGNRKGGEDTTATGWSIDDGLLEYANRWDSSGTSVLRIALSGSLVPTQTVVLHASSDSGAADGITSDTTPDITVAGFGNSASVTVTATKVGTTTTKSKSGTGNGAYTLPALSEGKWRVVARDTTTGDTTLYITITIDTTAPVLSDIQNLGTVGTTPSFTFTSSEAGVITWGGDCASATTAAVAGENTVTFNTLSIGAHSNCTVRVTDAAGNQSTVTPIPAFTVSTVFISVAAIDQSNPAQSRSTTATVVVGDGGAATDLKWRLFDPNANTPEVCDSTLDFTTSSTYTSGTAVEIANTEADNGKQACFRATASGTTVYQASAVITGIDRTGPVISNVGSIGFTTDTTPNVTYDIDEAATVTITCGGATTTDNPSASGSRTKTLGTAVTAGVHRDCTIDAEDAVGNAATQVAIPAFRVMSTLVSNINFASYSGLTVGPPFRGQRFDTGSTPYVLKRVQFIVHTASAANAGREFSVSIYGSDSNNLPTGTALATAALPHTAIESAGTKTVTFDEPVHLQASSAYHVVFAYSGSGGTGPRIGTTGNQGESGLSGFGIHNVREESTDGVAWVAQGGTPMRINVIGFAVPTQTIDLIDADDTGASNSDNITKDTTPKFNFTGFPVGSPVTLTFRKGNVDKTVSFTPATPTFVLGFVGLHAITEGVWRAFATSGVDTTLSLEVTIDTTPPELSNLQDLGTVYTQTPTFTFTSSEAGSLVVRNGCLTSDATVVKGENTINLNLTTAGTKSGCIIRVTDAAGNVSADGTIPTFTVLVPGVAIPLVANTGQTNGNSRPNLTATDVAQMFTTGDIPFELSSVGFSLKNSAPDTNGSLTVSIQGADGTNPDGITLASKVVTGLNTVGNKTADFSSANLILKPNTSYFVHFDYTHASDTLFTLEHTSSNAEDAGGQSGFSIADTARRISSGSWSSFADAVEISVSGSPGPMMYLKSTSDTGKSPHDRRTFDPTPTVVLSGFTGTVTVRATASGETAVQVTRDGNGEVTIPYLTPGKAWAITATDTASTPNTDTLTVHVDDFLVGNLDLDFGVNRPYYNLVLNASQHPFAQVFTTDADAYALEEIQYLVRAAAADLDNEFIISVQGVGNDGNPDGNDLATINVDHDVIESTGRKTAVFDVPFALAANTKYAIVFDYAGTGNSGAISSWSADRGNASRHDEDPSATGWSIDNEYHYFSSGAFTPGGGGTVISMALKGSRVPAQSVDLKASSDTGISNTDHITSVNTPTIVVAGFGGTDAVTVTAQKAGTNTTVSKAGTGNGDYVLPELSDGKWYITARNAVPGDRTLRIAITVDSDHPDLLISNTGQTDSSTTTNFNTEIHAQAFTTGSTPFELSSVGFTLGTATSGTTGTFLVRIQGSDGTNPDGVDLASAEVTTENVAGDKIVDFSSANLILKPSTTYFVAFSYSGTSDAISLRTTASDNEDAGGKSGFSIANAFRRHEGTGWSGVDRAIELSVLGSATGPTVYLKSTSDTGKSPHDRRTFDYTPTVVLSGFTGTVTVRATAGGETAVQKTRSGDGEVTLPRLTPGKPWNITATDTASTPNTDTLTVHVDNLLVGNVSGDTRYSAKQIRNNYRIAQRFTTDAGAYALEEIQYGVFVAAADADNAFTISVQGVANNGRPDGTKLATINVDHDVLESTGLKTAALDVPLALFANTSYFIVFEYVGAGNGFNIALWGRDRDGLTGETPSATAWSIYNGSLQADFGTTSTYPVVMALKGSRVPAQSVDLKASSDTGVSNTDNITSVNTPTIVVAGFDASDAVTVTAQKAGTNTTVSKAGTGNGDYVLPELSDGKWYITASNVLGDRALRIAITVDSDNPELLVKNTGQALSSGVLELGGTDGTNTAAQGFTTGADAYSIKQVQYALASAPATGETFTVSIQGVSGGNPDGTKIASVDVDHDDIETVGLTTTTFATPAILDANTSYFVVFEYSRTTSSGIDMRFTNSNNEDAGGVSGWSIADDRRSFSTSTSAWVSNSAALPIGLYGSVLKVVDLKASSDTGISNTDNITSDNTPTVTVTGFASDATITVTAEHATADDVVVEKSTAGNGDVDLTELADGVWSITASDGTSTTSVLSVTIDSDNPDIFVKNTGQTTDLGATGVSGSLSQAQQFTTGADAYRLKQVQYHVYGAVPDATGNEAFTVSIQGVSGGTPDGVKIASVDVDHDDVETTGLKTATFATAVALAANTSYFVVFEYSDTNAAHVVGLTATSSDSEDAGGVTGWSIADDKRAGDTWASDASTLLIGLYGTVVQYRVDLQSGSDSGTSQTDNITNDTTPTFDVTGFESTATVTVTATHATADEVSVEKSTPGNGAVTLTTLAEGDWTVVASDDASPANTSPSITVTVDTTVPNASIAASNFDGHLVVLAIGSPDGIDKAEATASPANLITAPSQSFTYGYKVVLSSATCDGSLTYATAIPQTDDVPAVDGTYKVCIEASDVAGNKQYLATPTFVRDTVPPVLTEVSAIGQTLDTTPDVTFRSVGAIYASAADNPPGCTLPGGTDIMDVSSDGVHTYTLPELSLGTYVGCQIVIGDEARNEVFVTTPAFSIVSSYVALHPSSGRGDNVDAWVADDNMTGDSTPTVTLAGFGSSATVNITATSDGQTAVTASRTGNGDKELPTLVPGEWLITATDGTKTSTLTITVLPTLVGNLAETNDGTVVVGDFDNHATNVRKIAQAFTTGANQYRLREVHVDIGTDGLGANSSFEIELMTSDGSGNPSARVTANGCDVFDGIAHSEVSTGAFVYEIPESKECRLAANTEYFLVFQVKDDAGSDVSLTTVSSDAQSGITSWSIEDECRQADVDGSTSSNFGSAGTWSDCAGGRSVKMALFGTSSFSIDLDTASDSGSSQTDNITKDTTPSFTVAGGFSGTVTVTGDHGTAADVTATRTGDGPVPFTTALTAQGEWTFTASDGTNTSAPLTVVIDTTAPSISNVGSIPTGFDTTPDLTFDVSEDGVLVAKASCGIPAVDVSSGSNTITLTSLAPNTYASCTFTMTDVAGNVSSAASIPSFTINSGGISVDALSTDSATSRSATATVTGTNPTGLNWALFSPNAQPAETCGSGLTFPAGNTYTSGVAVVVSSSEADNDKKVCFRATVAGNTVYEESDAIAGIDTTNPVAVLTFSTDQAVANTFAAFTPGGTDLFLKSGQKVRFTDASTDTGGIDESTRDFAAKIGTTAEYTANNAADLTVVGTPATGVWTHTATRNGFIKYTYSVDDEAGNSNAISETTLANLFVDVTAPATPVIDLTTASDTGASNSDNITKDATPTFSITNDNQRVKSSGGVAIDNTAGKSAESIEWHLTAAGSNTFTKQTITTASFTPAANLTDGVYKIKAAFVDAAGNKTESTVITFTVDTTVPSAPTALDLATADDTGVSNTDNITNKTTGLTFSVTATGENGSTVQLYSGSTAVGDATTVSGGSVSIDIPLSQGTHTITAKTTDTAGNVSTASSPVTVTVDTTAPAAITDHRPTFAEVHGGIYFEEDITPTISFNPARAARDLGGYKVHIVANSTTTNATCPTKAATTDTLTSLAGETDFVVIYTWLTNLSEGKYCLYVEQSDVAGNRTVSAPKTMVIDTTAPDVSTIAFNLLDASDSTRPEVAEDSETDSDNLWNPGKTDDYTKETSVSIAALAIAAETHLGALSPLKLELINGADVSKTKAYYTPGSASSANTFTAVTLNTDGTNTFKGKTNSFTLKVTDAAGNHATTAPFVVTADTVTKAPATPDLSADTDTGASTTDNFTNADYLAISIEDDDDDTNREYPTIARLYKWVDADADRVVEASELTVLKRETSPDDDTDNLADLTYRIKGASGGADLIFTNIVLPEGEHYIVAGQIDKAGNPETYSAALTIHIDRTAPDAPGTPDLHTDDDSQGANANAARDGTKTDDLTNIYENLDFASAASGSHTPANGPHDHHQIRFYVWTPASSSDTSVGDDELTELKPVAITAASNIAIIRDQGYSANGQRGAARQLYTTGADVITEGIHKFVAKQYDIAGNLSAVSEPLTLYVDLTPPDRLLVDPHLHPSSDSGDSNKDKQTSSADLLFTFTPVPMSTDIDYFEVRRVRLTDDLKTVSGESYAYPSSPTAVEQTSYEYITDEQNESNLVAEAGDTYADGAYQNGGAVKITAMDIPHFNTWYAFAVYAIDLAGNVVQGANSTNVRILVPPPKPATMDLAVASDSGSEDDDNITSATSWNLSGQYQNTSSAEQTADAAAGVQRVVVSVKQLDGDGQATETLTHTFTTDTDQIADNDITAPQNANDPYTYSFTFDATDFADLADGVYEITATSYNAAGEKSSASTPLVITLDRTAPVPEEHITVRTTVFSSASSVQAFFFTYANPSGNEPGAFVTVSNADGSWTDDIASTTSTVFNTENLSVALSTYTVVYTDVAGNSSEKIALKTSSLPPMVTSYVTDPGTDTKFVVIGVAADGTALTTAVTYDQQSGFCNPIGNKANPGTFTLSEIVTVSTDYCVEVQDAGGNIRAIRIKGDKSSLIANAEVLDEDDNGRSADDRVTNDPNPRYRATTLPGASVRMQSRVQATQPNAFSNIQTITAHADTGAFTLSGILPQNATEDSVIELQGYVQHTALGDAEIGPVSLPAVTIDLTDPAVVSNLFDTHIVLSGSDDTGPSNSDRITSETSVVLREDFSIYTVDNATEGDKLILTNTTTEETQHIIISQSTQDFPAFTLTGDGIHSFSAVTEDLAGNRVSYTDTLDITLDSTEPDITVIRLNDTDTIIDANTRFIIVASDDTTTTFSYVKETKASCTSRSSVTSNAYTAGTVFDPDDNASDGYCFIALDAAGNLSKKHTDDAIEGVGSFAIQGGTQVASTIHTTSGSKTITGISAPNARVLIKVAPSTDDPTTYTDTQLQSTSFATTTFTIPAGETTFSATLNLASGDHNKRVIGWIWTDKDDATTATPAILLTTLTIDDQAPIITLGTITSDNSNPAFAKQGDVITATFTTNEVIAAHTAVINGLPATCTDSNNSFSCTATLTNAADEGVATLVASVTDRAGNTTTNTFTNPGITIDATAPAVAITNLSSKHFKATGTENITITITDSNEIQAGTYTITASGATLSTCAITVPVATSTTSTSCTLTTASATDGTPVVLTIPTLVDASGNSKASHSITLGYVDTQAPQIDQAPVADASKRRKLTFTLAVTHNQHASNTNPETITPVFAGDCSDFDADTDWTGTGTATYTTTLSVPQGTYETCTVAVMDEAGNTSSPLAFAEFRIKGGGGVARIGSFISGAISSVADVFSGGTPPAQQAPTQQEAPQAPPTLFETTFAPEQTTPPSADAPDRDLTIGSVGEDVRNLQRLLNSLGFTISESGSGSPGEESTYFGEKTRQALIRYQLANGISPASGYYGPLTRASLAGQSSGQQQQDSEQSAQPAPQQQQVSERPAPQQQVQSQPVQQQDIQTSPAPVPAPSTRDLTIGSVGEDVRALQRLLNSLGFTISESGAGSPGQESAYFGEKTRQALIRYQLANGISPASGYYGPLTRSSIAGQLSSQNAGQRQEVGSFVEESAGEVRSFIEPVEQTPAVPQQGQFTDLYEVRQPSFGSAPQLQEGQSSGDVGEVRSFVETVEPTPPAPEPAPQPQAPQQQVEDTSDYEPITEILYRPSTRLPSFEPPKF